MSNKKEAVVLCQGCGIPFPSRNAMFRHLKETNAQCLPPEEYRDFLLYVHQQKRSKVLILFGYLTDHNSNNSNNNNNNVSRRSIRNGTDAAQLILEVIEMDENRRKLQGNDSGDSPVDREALKVEIDPTKINRSYGSNARPTVIIQQDDHTGAISEVLATRLPDLLEPLEEWIDRINVEIEKTFQPRSNNDSNRDRPQVRVLGRMNMSHSQFNAEMDVTHRRVEYLMPMDFFYGGNGIPGLHPEHDPTVLLSREAFFQSMPSFRDGTYGRTTVEEQQQDWENLQGFPRRRPPQPTLTYLLEMKRKMQSLTTGTQNVPPSVDGDTAAVVVVVKKTKSDKKQNSNGHRKGRDQKNRSSKKGSTGRRKDKKTTENMNNKTENNDAIVNHGQTVDDNKQENNDTIASDDKAEDDKKTENNDTAENSDEKENNNKTENNEQIETIAKTEDIGSNNNINKDDETNHGKPEKHASSATSSKPRSVVKRRRYHNFTPTVMAHELIAYRRLDRLYHRATLRYYYQPSQSQESDEKPNAIAVMACRDDDETQRPFAVMSMTGDLFLHGQALRVMGVVIALARGLIDVDLVECLFDENYGHLVPTTPAPTLGLYAADASYVGWEGKVDAVLSPRRSARYRAGFCDHPTMMRVEIWRDEVRRVIAQTWLDGGANEHGRLLLEKEWSENVLEPWVKRAKEQLEEYRQWKMKSSTGASTASKGVEHGADSTSSPAQEPGDENATVAAMSSLSLQDIDPTVPPLYEKVLFYLRQADASGLWPSTTPKRQLVMISNLATTTADQVTDSDREAVPTSLSDAMDKARANRVTRSSAYVFAEGQGGASGSFSVGAMPGDRCIQPKGNTLFPQLMKAAFELEIALRPDREPSSTIAINRNAQFRPHVDSGAGAGQSTSLIVGLGTYAGGELVVEGERKDIRYNAIEFDGWKQRHWTMPFQGERFSLVWFTPKGCEGIRGIDLCGGIVDQ